MKLTSDNVYKLFVDCLFRDDEIDSNRTTTLVEAIYVNGITIKVGFCAERVRKNAKDIADLCNQLSVEFEEGSSFERMCYDKDGNQWTDFQKSMQELLVLGVASGCLKINGLGAGFGMVMVTLIKENEK